MTLHENYFWQIKSLLSWCISSVHFHLHFIFFMLSLRVPLLHWKKSAAFMLFLLIQQQLYAEKHCKSAQPPRLHCFQAILFRYFQQIFWFSVRISTVCRDWRRNCVRETQNCAKICIARVFIHWKYPKSCTGSWSIWRGGVELNYHRCASSIPSTCLGGTSNSLLLLFPLVHLWSYQPIISCSFDPCVLVYILHPADWLMKIFCWRQLITLSSTSSCQVCKIENKKDVQKRGE